MAFSIDYQGQLHVLYKPCHADARIYSIRLSAAQDPVWSVASREGSTLREFTVGVVPDGFSELTPLAALVPNMHLVMSVATSELPADSEGFDRSELKTDQVLVPRRGFMTPSKFLLSNTCG
jgi:hypothetical protein